MSDPVTNEELAAAIGKLHKKSMEEGEPIEGFDPAAGTMILEVPEKGWVRLTGVYLQAIDYGKMDEAAVPVVFDDTVLAEEVDRDAIRKWWREIEGGLRQ